MNLNTEHIKLIFGLKLKQLRNERGITLNELSKSSGLSVSYINEIEKGKKYPKSDKIMSLAEAIGVEYDMLVSLKLNKKLEPISELLNSNFLSEIPFDFFGIDIANLFEMLSDAPLKLSAFINTIIEIARNYSMSVEQFYFAVLRSYQEMHENYFPDLEEVADNFIAQHAISLNKQLDEFYLTNILREEYNIDIKYFDEEDYPAIANIRSVFIPKKNRLLINKRISSDQRAFTMAREIGFLFMKLKERPMTSSWIEVNSFEEVLNNFKASYFAGAILIRKEKLIQRLNNFFSQETWKPELLNEMVDEFQATPETLQHRMSNLLPYHFGIHQFFFLRFEAPVGSNNYQLTKEMHLSKQHHPHATIKESYCRRWISLNILDDLSAIQQDSTKKYTKPLIDAQFSSYHETENEYVVISMARPLNILKQINVSVSLGIEINKELKEKIKFLPNMSVKSRVVNKTCERCSIFDCTERVAAPNYLQRDRQIEDMKKAIAAL